MLEMPGVFDVGSPAATFAALAAGTAVKFVAGALLTNRKVREYRLVGKVGEVWIYPVKSIRGISVTEARVGRFGLTWNGAGDRQWVVTRSNGTSLTMTMCPSMALIQPAVCGDEMELRASGMDHIRFPLHPQLTSNNLSKVIIGKDTVSSLDLGDDVGDWLSKFLKMDGLRLHFSEESLEKRESLTKEKPWGNSAKKGDITAFANINPYLILSQESVNFLNTKLDKPVTTANFRPNILIHDCEAYEEDNWTSVKIGDACLRALDCCTRCPLITVDQATGTLDKSGEPLVTLKTFRLKERYAPKLCFGVYFANDKLGLIQVGDPVYATVLN